LAARDPVGFWTYGSGGDSGTWLSSTARPSGPSAAQRFIELDDAYPPIDLGLGECELGREKPLLSLENLVLA